MVTQSLFARLGVPYTCSLLGSIAGALGCVPFVFYGQSLERPSSNRRRSTDCERWVVYGPKLRGMSRMAKSDLPENP
jgi:hypothetical protein